MVLNHRLDAYVTERFNNNQKKNCTYENFLVRATFYYVELEGVALDAASLLQSVATKRTLTRGRPHEGVTSVELEGVEPSSARGNHVLSTRLFQTSFSSISKTWTTNQCLIS